MSLYIPDNHSPKSAKSRTTHLGIGAHQDDLEFMALHGILECFQSEDLWFGGVTCTDGAGSSRTGKYADYTDEEMKAIRVVEQNTAASIGQYSFMEQLGHPSSTVKSVEKRKVLVEELSNILRETKPQVIYTHNPFDKHATHIGVMVAVLDAVATLPVEERPEAMYGCEVWRGLDWLPDELKVLQDVSAHPNLAASLNGVFDSQITGGKRYDLAVQGRRVANATFLDPHSIDECSFMQCAVDMSPLLRGECSLREFVEGFLNRSMTEMLGLLDSVSID